MVLLKAFVQYTFAEPIILKEQLVFMLKNVLGIVKFMTAKLVGSI